MRGSKGNREGVLPVEENKVEQKGRCPPRGASRRKYPGRYPFEVRLKAVKLHEEEGFSLDLIGQEMGVCRDTIFGWVVRYRERGEAGLAPQAPYPGSRKAKVSPAIKAKITQVKKEHPSFGVKRISQWLRRVLFLPASPETVRRTLHRQGLMPKTRKKTPRNPARPRFFERSTPNQMWQSDIFTFRLGGRNAYLIGFVDDYSRYMTGLDLFRSQSAEHVLEVYRTALGEYGVPKEMLTDQGRQYANWRGKTRFQLELQKDRVHHLMSRPHHPMTLGKIERFWKTIWEEFLVRAQFGSFEEAQARVRYWVKYYNHKRPHQGLNGLCPADRFFEIQQELRKIIEQGIAENVQELALNRPPKDPFYMVGRMGGQSVVMTVEKGQFKMQVDGEEPVTEVTYEVGGKTHDNGTETDKEGARPAQREGAVPGGALGVDGAAAPVGNLPGTGDRRGAAAALAEPSHGGDAESAGAEGAAGAGSGTGAGAESPTAAPAEDRAAGREDLQTGAATGEAATQPAGGEGAGGEVGGEGRVDEFTEDERREGPGAGGADRAGPERPLECERSGAAPGGLPEDILQVGEAGALEDGGGPAGPGGWPAVAAGGLGEGDPEETGGGPGGAGAGAPAG
jgi:transposase InsO family protein